MNIFDILENIEERIAILDRLDEPGPVELEPGDEEADQDSLFMERRVLQELLALSRRLYRE